MTDFENMTYEGVIRFAIREMVQAGAKRLQASTIQLYLQDHHGVRCNLGTIEAVCKQLAQEGVLTPKAPGEVQS